MGNVDTVRRGWVMIVVGAFISGALVGSTLFSESAQAQVGSRYNHFHFRAGSCQVGTVVGQGVIDLRNGNTWCVPVGKEGPFFEGTLNLAAVPDRLPPGR
jgi:hypothetical protein